MVTQILGAKRKVLAPKPQELVREYYKDPTGEV